MTDIGGETALQIAELLELGDLVRQALGHLVERLRQPRHVVLAAHQHAFFESAVGESARDSRGRPDRQHHLPGDQRGDRGEQHQQDHPTDEHRAAHQRQARFLARQREDQVDLQRRDLGTRAADDQRTPSVTVGVGDGGELVGDLVALDESAQFLWDLRDRTGGDLVRRCPADHRQRRVETPRGAAGLTGAATAGQRGSRVVELLLLAAAGLDARHLVLDRAAGTIHLLDSRVDLGFEEPVGDLTGQHDPEDRDHEERKGQRRDDDSQLQRPAPQVAECGPDGLEPGHDRARPPPQLRHWTSGHSGAPQ